MSLFEEHTSELAFIIGFNQVILALFCEAVNVYMLTFQHTVEHCIIHFVALEVIMEVTKMYFEAIDEQKLKSLVHHPPKLVVRGKDIVFSDRSCFHKFARCLYKVLRCIYVSLIFYFVPFSVILLQWELSKTSHGH